MSVFQTGKIIITGARYMYQLEEAQKFLNAVLQKHAHEVLRLPTETPATATTTPTPKTIRTIPRKKAVPIR